MPLKFKKRSVLIFLLVLFLSFGLVSGGLYYYLEIYIPERYAKEILPLFEQMGSQPPETANLKGGGDYEGALNNLNIYDQYFSQKLEQLQKLHPSLLKNPPSFLANAQRSQQIQEDFTKILEVFKANIGKAKQQVQFASKAKELFLLLRPDLNTYPPKAVPAGQTTPLTPAPNTVSEFLAVWEARVPKAKKVAQALFSEPQDLGEVSFEELESLWLETEQGLDNLIPFLKKQNPKLTISELQKLVPENEQVVFAKVDKIDEFLPLLEKVLIRNNAENILNFQFSSDSVTQSELNVRYKRLDAAIKAIKVKSSQ